MVTPQLKRVARAMAAHEGWNPMMSAMGTLLPASISYRHSNPGNLRSSPYQVSKKNGFAVFLDDDVGWFALWWDIWMKCHGRTVTGLTPQSTIADLISVYAPPSENDTGAYIAFVEERSGLPRTTKLHTLVEAW